MFASVPPSPPPSLAPSLARSLAHSPRSPTDHLGHDAAAAADDDYATRKYKSGKELQVGGFDLVWKNGPVPRTQNVSFLGSVNDQTAPIEQICKVKRAKAVTKAQAAAAAAGV